MYKQTPDSSKDNTRDTSTCTCDFICITPLGSSTPLQTSLRVEDCCTETELSIIESVIEHINNTIEKECTENDTNTVDRVSNIASSVTGDEKMQPNKTYTCACNKLEDVNKTFNFTSSKTKFVSKERLNKTCDLKSKAENCSVPVIYARDTIELDTRSDHKNELKLCDSCKDIVDFVPKTEDIRKQLEINDKLCEDCKELIKSCQPAKSSKILDQIYEKCKDVISSITGQADKPGCAPKVKHETITSQNRSEPIKSSHHQFFIIEPPKFTDKACDPILLNDSSFGTYKDDKELQTKIMKPSNKSFNLSTREPSCIYIDKACDTTEFVTIKSTDETSQTEQIEDISTKSRDKSCSTFENPVLKYEDQACDPVSFDEDPSFNCDMSSRTVICDEEHEPRKPVMHEKLEITCDFKPCGFSSPYEDPCSSRIVDQTFNPCSKVRGSHNLPGTVNDPINPNMNRSAENDLDPTLTIKRDHSEDKTLTSDSFTQPLKYSTPSKYVRLHQLIKKEELEGNSKGMIDDKVKKEKETASTPELRKRATCACAHEESMCGSASPLGSSGSARAQHYQTKLHATLQILQNKEETIRVQAESLAVADSRISALTARHNDLRREVERKEKEIQRLQETLKGYSYIEKSDVSVSAEDVDTREDIVTTLQNNLGVIEELYRESFYESVKQENLIEMLRQSNLDIRLSEKRQTDRITDLSHIVNSQRHSLDKCQDIATEVENLKMEISNFINSSSNDSGMWETSLVGEISEDLQDIAAQLMRLKDLLAVCGESDCTCGLAEENRRLKRNNQKMEEEIRELRSKISDLEANSRNFGCIEKQYQDKLATKDTEICNLRQELQSATRLALEKSHCVDTLSSEIAQIKGTLDEKSAESDRWQKQCSERETTISVLREQLCNTDQIAKDNVVLRSELSSVSRRASQLQRRAADLEAELARARAHADSATAAYSEQSASAAELERQLESAQARGAALCAEAGHVLRAVRHWAARMTDMHREQEKQLKLKECKLQHLHKELSKRSNQSCSRIWDQSCSRPSSIDGASCSKYVRINETCDADCVRQRRDDAAVTSASEMASCSTAPSVPKRACAKKPAAVASTGGIRLQRRHGWLGPLRAAHRDAAAQSPRTRDLATCSCDRDDICPVSAGEEMLSRMAGLSEALADGYRRWTRRGSDHR